MKWLGCGDGETRNLTSNEIGAGIARMGKPLPSILPLIWPRLRSAPSNGRMSMGHTSLLAKAYLKSHRFSPVCGLIPDQAWLHCVAKSHRFLSGGLCGEIPLRPLCWRLPFAPVVLPPAALLGQPHRLPCPDYDRLPGSTPGGPLYDTRKLDRRSHAARGC